MRHRQLAIVAALIVALAGGSWLIGSGSAQNSPKVSAELFSPATREQRYAFRITDAPARELPFRVSYKLRKTVPPWFDLNFKRGWRVQTVAGSVAWIVAGPRYICIVDAETVVSGCNTTKATVRHGMSEIIHSANRYTGKYSYLLLGIVRNRIRSVSVRQGRYRSTIEVHDNVFAISTRAFPHIIGFRSVGR